jgi:penicillin-binding protein 1A
LKGIAFKLVVFLWVTLVLGGGFISFFFWSVSTNFLNLFGTMPSLEILENPESELASEIYFSDGSLIGKYYRYNRQVAVFEDLSKSLVQALLAQEDIRFYDHSGVDLEAILRAVFFLGQRGGGSTLTQQLAKNLYKIRGDHNTGTLKGVRVFKFNTIVSKAKEMITAIKLERAFTKEEILTMYLNTVDFGGNSFGIKVAAKTFFGTSTDSLKPEEAGVLVGVLGATNRFNPVYNYDNSFARRNQVLTQMEKYNFLTKKESDSLRSLPINLENYGVENQNKGLAPYFRTRVKVELMHWCKKNGYDLFADGLKVYSTIDPRLQEIAENAVSDWMMKLQDTFNIHWQGREPWVDEEFKPLKGYIRSSIERTPNYRMLKKRFPDFPDSIKYYLNKKKKMRVFSWEGEIDTLFSSLDSLKYYRHFLHTGFMAMDPYTGHVKTWVGGINHKYFKFDHVKQGKRQPGSTFKPLVYTAAIDNGFSPCFQLEDAPVTFILPSNESYTPNNASGRFSYRKLTLREALARSVNSATANLLKRVGVEVVVDYAKKLGIRSHLDAVPSLCLGTSDVSLFELIGTYATFANKGIWVEPYYISRIEDKYGNIIREFVPKTAEALNPESAAIMLYMLRGSTELSGGTGLGLYRWNLREGNQIAAKTGTTSNYSDGWFMGITKDLVAGCWVGGEERSIHFRTITLGSGARMAMPIWGRFMQKAYEDSIYTKGKLDIPEDLETELDCNKYLKSNPNDSLDLIDPSQFENPDKDIFSN